MSPPRTETKPARSQSRRYSISLFNIARPIRTWPDPPYGAAGPQVPPSRTNATFLYISPPNTSSAPQCNKACNVFLHCSRTRKSGLSPERTGASSITRGANSSKYLFRRIIALSVATPLLRQSNSAKSTVFSAQAARNGPLRTNRPVRSCFVGLKTGMLHRSSTRRNTPRKRDRENGQRLSQPPRSPSQRRKAAIRIRGHALGRAYSCSTGVGRL